MAGGDYDVNCEVSCTQTKFAGLPKVSIILRFTVPWLLATVKYYIPQNLRICMYKNNYKYLEIHF